VKLTKVQSKANILINLKNIQIIIKVMELIKLIKVVQYNL